MRIAVVGAGAIGAFVAAAIARSGADVAVVARGAQLDAIHQGGITVTQSDLGAFAVRVPAAPDIASLGAFDAVVATFKSHQWTGLLSQFAMLRAAPTLIVTLQNGIPFWFQRTPPLRCIDPDGAIGTIFPDERVIGGVVHVSGHIVAPGKVHQSGGLRYVLGTPSGQRTPALEALRSLLAAAGLEPEIDDAIRRPLWLKVVNNIGLNPLSALHRLSIGPMLRDPAIRAQARVLMEEALAVGRALRLVAEVDVEARIAYAMRLGDVKTSMLQDVEAGRPLELDPILGGVIELAQRVGIQVPNLEATYQRLMPA
jgi:2-dehydropantoate 2-reductase